MERGIHVKDLRREVKTFVAGYPAAAGVENIWRTPLVATAAADRRFAELPRIAADDHWQPADLLPTAASVIVFFIPFAQSLCRENHPGKFPCRNWGLAYQRTNTLIGAVSESIRAYLTDRGARVELTPATHNFDPRKLVSRWSHKHLGHLAGLGRFGVNAQFITPAGCAGRMGSLVTDARLGDHPLVEAEELCLHKRGLECLACVKRCPVKAVGLEGIDRRRCWERLNFNLKHVSHLAGLEESTHVCGKCQVLVPCSLGIPQENP